MPTNEKLQGLFLVKFIMMNNFKVGDLRDGFSPPVIGRCRLLVLLYTESLMCPLLAEGGLLILLETLSSCYECYIFDKANYVLLDLK